MIDDPQHKNIMLMFLLHQFKSFEIQNFADK